MKKIVRTVEISFERDEKVTVDRRQTLREEKDDISTLEAHGALADTEAGWTYVEENHNQTTKKSR